MITRLTRRAFLGAVPALAGLPYASNTAALPPLPLGQPELGLRITDMELTVVRATARTNWIFLRLTTNDGLTGLGEASMGRRAEFPEIAQFYDLVRERSPFEIRAISSAGLERRELG